MKFCQVDLDVESAQSITDSAGFINKEDFMRFAKDKKLADFDERRDKDETPKKEWAPAKTGNNLVTKKQEQIVKMIYILLFQSSSGGLLCCCGGSVSPEPEPDRVELAFKRMDRNRDGFLTWEEFNKVCGQIKKNNVGIFFLSHYFCGYWIGY